MNITSNRGRKGLYQERMLQGIYYVLKNGIQWKYVPRCFGSASAVHNFFQKRVNVNFLYFWKTEISRYYNIQGLNVTRQAIDRAHRKNPIGQDKARIRPVDRKKQGTKIACIKQ